MMLLLSFIGSQAAEPCIDVLLDRMHQELLLKKKKNVEIIHLSSQITRLMMGQWEQVFFFLFLRCEMCDVFYALTLLLHNLRYNTSIILFLLWLLKYVFLSSFCRSPLYKLQKWEGPNLHGSYFGAVPNSLPRV